MASRLFRASRRRRWGLGAVALLACTAACRSGPRGGAPDAGRLLADEIFVDTAVTTRFYRFEGEPAKTFDPARLLAEGCKVAVLGAGALAEERYLREISNTRPPEAGKPCFLPVFTGAAAVKRVLWELDAVRQAAERHADRVGIALSARDVEEIARRNKLALVVGLDSGAAVEDLASLRMYHRLGLRKLAVVHAGPVSWANSCFGFLGESDRGLSDFGKSVVRECNRLGVLVDLSHASDATMRAAIETSEKPVFASHSGARAVTNSLRNLTDDLLRALAAKGGMIGVGAYYDQAMFDREVAAKLHERTAAIHRYLGEQNADPFQFAAAIRDPARMDAARQALGFPELPADARVREGGSQITEVSDVRGTLDHVDYLVRLIGVDHVGLGTDIDMRRPDYPAIVRQLAAGLVERGYQREEIRKILGGNFLALMRANEPPAGAGQSQ